jgi:hypothetical protein
LLCELYNRNGFDDWWGGISGLIRDEIRARMVEIVRLCLEMWNGKEVLS